MEQMIISGRDNALSSTATEYNCINGGYTWTNTQGQRTQVVSAPGNFKDMKIQLSGSPGSGNSYTFTIMVNGAASDVVITISNLETTGSDIINTAAVVAGDLVEIRCVPSSTPSVRDAGINIIFQGTDSTESLILGGGLSFSTSSSATRYNWLDNMDTWEGTESDRQQIVSSAGTIKKLYVELSQAPGVGKDFTFTVMKNGVAQSLEVTIADAATTGNDVANTISVVAGDKIIVRCVPSGTPAINTFVDLGAVFVPTTSNEFVFMNGISNDTNISSTEYNYFSMTSVGSWTSSETNRKHGIGQSTFVLKKFYVELQNAPGVGKSFTFTIRQNQTATSLIVTISDSDTTGNDTANEVELSDFDNLSIQCSPSGSPTVGNVYWGVTGTVGEVTPSEDISETDTVVTDAIVLGWTASHNVLETDTVVTDSVGLGWTASQGIAETDVTVTDSVSAGSFLSQLIGEIDVTIDDVLTIVQIFSGAVTETDVTITDSVTLNSVFSVDIAETLTMTDGLQGFAPSKKWFSVGV